MKLLLLFTLLVVTHGNCLPTRPEVEQQLVFDPLPQLPSYLNPNVITKIQMHSNNLANLRPKPIEVKILL